MSRNYMSANAYQKKPSTPSTTQLMSNFRALPSLAKFGAMKQQRQLSTSTVVSTASSGSDDDDENGSSGAWNRGKRSNDVASRSNSSSRPSTRASTSLGFDETKQKNNSHHPGPSSSSFSDFQSRQQQVSCSESDDGSVALVMSETAAMNPISRQGVWQYFDAPATTKLQQSQQRRHNTSNNNTITKRMHEAEKRGDKPSTVAVKPEFLVTVETRIERELAVLGHHHNNSAVATTTTTTSAASASASREERVRIFQEAMHTLLPHFSTYGPVLSRIVKEYDGFVNGAMETTRRVQSLETELRVTTAKAEHDAAAARVEIRQLKEDHKKEIEALDRRVKTGPSLFESLSIIDQLEKRVEEERERNQALHDKLGATARIRAEFARTTRSIEDTFNIISNEKDLELSKLRSEAAMEHRMFLEGLEKHHDETELLRRRLDSVEVQLDIAQKREHLLKEQWRHADNRASTYAQKLTIVQTENESMAERLAQFEGVPNLQPHDVATTPRPSKSDAVTRIPALGNATMFNSTNQLLAAIYEHFDALGEKIDEHEKVLSCLDDHITERTGIIREQVRDDMEREQQLRRERAKQRRIAVASRVAAAAGGCGWRCGEAEGLDVISFPSFCF